MLTYWPTSLLSFSVFLIIFACLCWNVYIWIPLSKDIWSILIERYILFECVTILSSLMEIWEMLQFYDVKLKPILILYIQIFLTSKKCSLHVKIAYTYEVQCLVSIHHVLYNVLCWDFNIRSRTLHFSLHDTMQRDVSIARLKKQFLMNLDTSEEKSRYHSIYF